MSSEFLKPRYEGARFAEHRLPVEVLRDLPLFQELILQTARWLFLQENRERKRLPKGWAANFRLNLTTIEEGSAVPVLELELDAEAAEFSEHFNKARDRVIETIRAASESDEPVLPLPPNILDIFDRLGSGLRGDERIYVGSPDGRLISILDRPTRLKLAKRGKSSSYEEYVELIGTLPALDQEHQTYILRLEDGTRIRGRYDAWLSDQMLVAHQAYDSGELFAVTGTALCNRDGTMERISETFDIDEPATAGFSLLPGFKELFKLKQGWYDGEQGDVPSPEDFQWVFNQYITYSEWAPFVANPTYCLTVDGKIRSEWLIKPWDVSLEIDATSKTGYLHALNLATDEEQELEELNLDTEEAWRQVQEIFHSIHGEMPA